VIAIAGTINLLDPADREGCIDAAKPYIRSTQEDEPGCHAYAFSPDPLVDGRIQVFELWADAETLEAHFAHPNFHAMKQVLGGYRRGPSQIRKYRVDLDAPVYDASGTPTAAFTGVAT
jgi:quinol monooxygenase YgiN